MATTPCQPTGVALTHLCQLIHPTRAAVLDPALLPALHTNALRLLSHIPDDALITMHTNSGIGPGGVLQIARGSQSPALVLATLERIANQRPRPTNLPIAIAQDVFLGSTPDQRLAIATAMRSAGFFCATREWLEAIAQALDIGEHPLARQIASFLHTAPSPKSFPWSNLCGFIWQQPTKHRPFLFDSLLGSLSQEPERLEQALKDASFNIAPLLLMLLLRGDPMAIPTAKTLRFAPYQEPSPLNRILFGLLTTAHGTLKIQAWPWSIPELLALEMDAAKERVASIAQLPTIKEAKAANKAARQHLRGRTRGPKGGDPNRRPPPSTGP